MSDIPFSQPIKPINPDQERLIEAQRESGTDIRTLPPPGSIPPVQGHWVVQHQNTFSSLQNLSSRSYLWTFDEALRDDTCNAKAMRFDPIIRGAIHKRTQPVCQLEFQVDAINPADPEQVEAAHGVTRLFEEIPSFQQMKRAMIEEGQFYGRAGVQVLFDNKVVDGKVQVAVVDWHPVNGDKLVFKYDGTPGLLVNAAEFTGTTVPTNRGMAHFFTLEEQECLYIYQFEPIDADFFESQLAGGVHGVGFRGQLYYYWWLKTNLQSQMLDFLQKVGQGFLIFYYEQSNPQSMAEVRAAAENQAGNQVMLFPRNRDRQSAYSGAGIEPIPMNLSGSQFFQEMIAYYDNIMTDYILGEALTTSTAATGLGSGVAQAHEDTADDRVKYDANDLEQPLQRLCQTFYRWNYPGVPVGKFRFVVDKRNVGEYMEGVSFAVQMGLDVDKDDIYEVLGLPRPQPGHAVLSKQQSLDPTAMNMVPENQPMAGTPGPEQQGGQEEQAQDQQGQEVVEGQPVQQGGQTQGIPMKRSR